MSRREEIKQERNTIRKKIGNRLRELRQSKNLTMAEVAKITNVSTSAVINNWEKGRRKPKNKYLKKYANYFNVSINWILTGENEFVDWMRKTNEFEIQEVPKSLSKKEKEIVLTRLKDLAKHFYSDYEECRKNWKM